MFNPFAWLFLVLHPLPQEDLIVHLSAMGVPIGMASLLLGVSCSIFLCLCFFLWSMFLSIQKEPSHRVRRIKLLSLALGAVAGTLFLPEITWRVHASNLSGEPAIIPGLLDFSAYALRMAMLPLSVDGLIALYVNEGGIDRVLAGLRFFDRDAWSLLFYPVIACLAFWRRTRSWGKPFVGGLMLCLSIAPTVWILVQSVF